jgi:hypothetical protein
MSQSVQPICRRVVGCEDMCASWKLIKVKGEVHTRDGDCNNKDCEDAETQTTTRAGAHGCRRDGGELH